MKNSTKIILKHFNFHGEEMLMEPNSGDVASSKEWVDSIDVWDDEKSSLEDQMSSLVEVEKVNGEWVEIK